MPTPKLYFVEERKDGDFAVKGEHKDRPAIVTGNENSAERKAHHFAGRGGHVDFKDAEGKFTHCLCPRCKKNR